MPSLAVPVVELRDEKRHRLSRAASGTPHVETNSRGEWRGEAVAVAVKVVMRYIPDGDATISSRQTGRWKIGAGSSVPMAGSRVQNGPFLDGLPEMGPLPLFGGNSG